MADLFHPPIKRSVEIAGHKTSISLEPLFWELLRGAAERRRLPINALVARIDEERLAAAATPGLGTALRLWLVADLVRQIAAAHAGDLADSGPVDGPAAGLDRAAASPPASAC